MFGSSPTRVANYESFVEAWQRGRLRLTVNQVFTARWFESIRLHKRLQYRVLTAGNRHHPFKVTSIGLGFESPTRCQRIQCVSCPGRDKLAVTQWLRLSRFESYGTHQEHEWLSERSKVTVCKTDWRKPHVGSNPTPLSRIEVERT